MKMVNCLCLCIRKFAKVGVPIICHIFNNETQAAPMTNVMLPHASEENCESKKKQQAVFEDARILSTCLLCLDISKGGFRHLHVNCIVFFTFSFLY